LLKSKITDGKLDVMVSNANLGGDPIKELKRK
jgi:hypothetical protein